MNLTDRIPFRLKTVTYPAKKGMKYELHVWRLNETGKREGLSQ